MSDSGFDEELLWGDRVPDFVSAGSPGGSSDHGILLEILVHEGTSERTLKDLLEWRGAQLIPGSAGKPKELYGDAVVVPYRVKVEEKRVPAVRKLYFIATCYQVDESKE